MGRLVANQGDFTFFGGDALESDREAVRGAELSGGLRSGDDGIAALYLVGCTPDQKREGHSPNGEKTVTRGRGEGVIAGEKVRGNTTAA